MGLSLTVQPSPFESATSWASRLAERNGISHVQDFVHDMGLDWKRFITGDEATITQLCELSQVNSASLLTHSMKKDSAGIKRLNREVIGSKVVLNREMSVCAQCVEEAQCAKTGRLTAGARVWWQLAHVRSCYHHNVMFTSLPTPQPGRCKYDFVGRIRDNAELVSRAATKPRSAIARNFELYMISRVCREKRRRNRWLDALELRVAAQACQSLGIVLRNRGKERSDQNSPEFLSWAAEVGFRALAQGPKSMWPAMQKVQARSSFRGSGFYTDFRPFARFVERLDDRPGTREIKNQVRDYVEHNYPVAAGEDVIGRAAKNRRLHSLVSAAEKTGTSWTRMRGVFQIIRDTGAVGHLTSPDRNLWVGCDEWDPWLEKYGTSLNIKRAASRLGVSFSAFQTIEKEGWIKPFISLPGHVDRFDPDVIDCLRDVFFDGTDKVSSLGKNMVEVFRIQSKCHCDTMAVLRLIKSQDLPWVGRRIDVHGLRSLVVRREDVLDALAVEPPPGLSTDKARLILRVNTSTIAWLANKGMIQHQQVRHHWNRKMMRLIPSDGVSRFLETYETLGRLAYTENIQANHVATRLERCGVYPLPLPDHLSRIYERDHLPPAYR